MVTSWLGFFLSYDLSGGFILLSSERNNVLVGVAWGVASTMVVSVADEQVKITNLEELLPESFTPRRLNLAFHTST